MAVRQAKSLIHELATKNLYRSTFAVSKMGSKWRSKQFLIYAFRAKMNVG